MRNKNTLKQSLLLAVLLPFLAFSVVLANHGADDEANGETEDHSVYEKQLKDEQKMKEREMKDALKLKENQLKDQMRTASAADKDALKAQLKDSKEVFKTERDDAREAYKNTRRGARVWVIKTVMETQIARSTKALDRLSLILDKIEAKAEDMPEGSNMTQANALIAKAKAQETALKAALDKAQDDFEALGQTKVEETSDDEPSETSQPVKQAKQAVKTYMATMKDIKKKLIEFHKTLHDSVKAMRQAAKAVEPDDDDSEEGEVTENEPENSSATNN